MRRFIVASVTPRKGKYFESTLQMHQIAIGMNKSTDAMAALAKSHYRALHTLDGSLRPFHGSFSLGLRLETETGGGVRMCSSPNKGRHGRMQKETASH